VEVAEKVIVKILWNAKDVTKDVSVYLSSFSYVDVEEGFSDDLTLSFDNSTGIWSNEWYPQKGDTLQAYFGFNSLTDSGLFEIDEITVSGPPDMIQVKCLAAGITKALRTRNNKAFENQTLRQIATFFAIKHNLKLVDQSSMLSKINLDRKTQKDTTDLKFLTDLAKEYGFIFAVRGNQLVFTSYYALDNAASIGTIDIREISSYDLTEKTTDTYASATFKARIPKQNKVINQKSSYTDWDGKIIVEDTLMTSGKATSAGQAEAKTNANLWGKNKFKQSGSISVPGNARYISGVNFDLTGIGVLSGKWHIVKSTHTIMGDYSMELEIRKTGTIPKPLSIAKKVTTKSQQAYSDLGENEEGW